MRIFDICIFYIINEWLIERNGSIYDIDDLF